MVLFKSPRSGRKHKAAGVSSWTDVRHQSEPAKRVIEVIHPIYHPLRGLGDQQAHHTQPLQAGLYAVTRFAGSHITQQL
jgi:hypothetical protein